LFGLSLDSGICNKKLENNFEIQLALLNGITLGPRETDSFNRLILISEQTKHTLGTIGNDHFGLVNLDKFDPIPRLIPSYVIPLRGICDKKLILKY
jgi:hypothetical protein